MLQLVLAVLLRVLWILWQAVHRRLTQPLRALLRLVRLLVILQLQPHRPILLLAGLLPWTQPC